MASSALVLLVPLKSPQWVEVHQVGFVMFKLKVQELLNSEQIYLFKKKINKTKNSLGILECLNLRWNSYWIVGNDFI